MYTIFMSTKLKLWISCAFTFILTFALFFHPIIDFSQDLGRHIKLGELIFQWRAVPKTNLFAYTYPNFPFINHHWMSEVIFYVLIKNFGTLGLLFIMSTITALSISIMVYFCLFQMRHSGAKQSEAIESQKILSRSSPLQDDNTKYVSIFIATLLYLGILLERTNLRPEIFSFFFVSMFMVILYKNRENFTKWLFLLPLGELLWVNMHIYFPIGILLIFLFLIDQIFVISRQSREISKRFEISHYVRDDNLRIFSIVFVLCCLATLLNPNGLIGALYPLHIFQNYGYSIAENQTLFFLINYGFRNISYLYFGITVLAGFCLLLLRRKQNTLIDWLLFITFTILAISATRNFPLFVFATFIPFVKNLAFVFGNTKYKILHTKYVFIGICLLTGSLPYFSIHANGFGYSIQTGPQEAADFFITNHLKGPIFNNFDIGSYLDYRLYPKEGVFVDGRPEAYPADFFQKEYIPMQEDPKIFEQVDKKYHFNTIFFGYTDQTPWANAFLIAILKNPSWKLIYFNESIVIIVKDTPNNQSLPALSEADSISGKIPLPQDFTSLARILQILDTLSWKNAEIFVLQKMLALDSHSCFALGTLHDLLVQKNDPAVGIYATQYQQFCQ